MIVHQKSLLQEFLKENRNMKLNIRTEAIFTKPEHLDGGDWDEFEESEILYKLQYLQQDLIYITKMT